MCLALAGTAFSDYREDDAFGVPAFVSQFDGFLTEDGEVVGLVLVGAKGMVPGDLVTHGSCASCSI